MRPPPERREDPIGPVIGSDVQTTKHLWSCDSFGVHPHLLVWFAAVRHGLHQHSDALRLAGSRRAESHHTVTYALRLIQLDQLQHPWSVMHQAELTHLYSVQVRMYYRPGKGVCNSFNSWLLKRLCALRLPVAAC